MANLTKLEEHLLTRSYVEGYTPSQADVTVFKALDAAPTTPNAARWYSHIKSYESEFDSLSGSSDGGKAFLGGAAEEAKADDDDEVDLFGSDDDEVDEEAEKLKAQRVAEYAAKKAGKAKPAAKSVVTLEVKPWDDETNLDELLANVKAIEMDGLVWGAHKWVPVGYGIKKLQITLVIEDDKVSLTDLEEKIAEDEDHVQSTDVAAMQKL